MPTVITSAKGQVVIPKKERERAPLVTGDPEFKKLGKTLNIDWVG